MESTGGGTMTASFSSPALLEDRGAHEGVNSRAWLPSIGGDSRTTTPAMKRGSSASVAGFPSTLPVIGKDHSFGKASSSGSGSSHVGSRRRLPLKKDVASEQSVLDAMRHELMQRTGSLKQAYAALDVHKTGRVNLSDFQAVLNSFDIDVSSFCAFSCFEALFEALAKGAAELSVQQLLGYVPIGNTRKMLSDTGTDWFEYHNKTSALRKVARQPAWRSKGRGKTGDRLITSDDELPFGMSSREMPTSVDGKSARMRRRRDLREQFREERFNMQSDEKRELVGGFVSHEEASEHWQNENRKLVIKRNRIEGAIRDCSKSRMALVDMQRMMSHLQAREAQADDGAASHGSASRKCSVGRKSLFVPRSDGVSVPTL
eukprot:TRINITY_DN35017_c0_g1_i1.p1 TRINITY_DN35017_c0_g1~~TRINITY_DN35017_c0_g1_i1.p1  ORF type:complete len:374 (-),score=50.39 TRINITY_DN35017_c0_g1_i1:260-1381(-)